MRIALVTLLLLVGIYWLAAGRPRVTRHYADGKGFKPRFLGFAIAADALSFYWHRLVIVALAGGAVALIALSLVVVTGHRLVRRRR